MPAVGSNTVSAKLSSTWKSWSNFWARHSGVWKKPLGVWVRRSGVWVKVWDERPSITNIVTSYNYDGSAFPPSTTYYKNFTVAANGFGATLTSNDPTGFGVTFSQTTVNANTSANVTTSTFAFGSFNAANYPTITATNSSGSVVF
jgi:hypothetical protein